MDGKDWKIKTGYADEGTPRINRAKLPILGLNKDNCFE